MKIKVFIVFLGLCGALHAQVIESNGTGGGRWDQTGTWVGGVIPTVNDSVLIRNGDNITLRSAEEANVVTVEGASVLRVNSNFSLTCDTLFYIPVAPATRFNLNLRSGAVLNANYLIMDMAADNSNPDFTGAGRVSITNDVYITSSSLAPITELRTALECRDM
jgi:hypothetical protein